MPYPLPLTRTEAYLAYKAGVIQQSDLKPSLAVPRNGIDAWLAYWTGLAADYPKREDGTPHILQEEEAYIAYLCGVINEYPEKCLRRVGAYLRYLISARWGRPDHPLNREELYLSLIKTQFIPSGDPSSDIEIDGTAKAAFVDVKMYGDTFQQTYSGKNLFNRENYGTLVGWVAQGEIKNYGNRVFYIQCKPGTTYTIQKMLAKPVERSRCQIFTTSDVPAVGVSVIGILFSTNGATQATVTTQSSANYLCIACYEAVASTETTVQEMADSIMIEEGATASPYEPYVGLQPSPNPDYQQPIHTVTGRQVVNVTGKNLNRFPYASGSSKTHRGVTFTANPDGSVTIKGTHDGSGTAIYYFRDFWDYNETNGVIVDANTTLTASITGGDGYGIRFIAEGYHSDETYDQFNTTSTQTITTTAKATFNGRITVYAGFSSTEGVTVYPMLEKGSTATAYEPYSSNDYEINLGKNLFDKDNVVKGIPQAADGSIGQTTGDGRTCEFIPVLPSSQYTHSGHRAGWAVIAFYRADKSFIQRVSDVSTITTPSDCAYASVSCSISNLGICQFELGSTATPYAPYFTPIELCKIGTYQDYIWKDGEEWKVHKATANITLNNTADTSNWSKSNSTANNVYINQNIPNLVKDSPIVATNLTTYPTADIYSRDIVGICYNTTGAGLASIRIGVGLSGANTINLFKSWLEENPVTAYYAIATPTDTIITNQTLIAQLEALVSGGAENGTTYIKVSAADPNLPGLLYVEAPKYD